MADLYQLSESNGLTKPSPRRILGLPERQVYRIGVFLFYVMLFVAISFFTRKVKLPQEPLTDHPMEAVSR